MVREVKVCCALGFVLVIALSVFCVESSEAKSFRVIYIHSDGSVAPSSVPIQREGDTYRLLDDLYNSPIVLERNHIFFDGEGHILEGAAQAIALNITCSNVTVRNLRAWNWDAGILGAYNNVTINNCNLTGNGKGIAIYADNYRVEGNYIAQNQWGIRVQGNNVVISGNQLVGNSIGIWVSSFQGDYSGNVITANTFETTGKVAIETDMGGGFTVYHNNFIIPNNQGPIVQTAYLVVPGNESKVVMPPWDNGVEGNYWSNYAAKYPNASEIGTSGVYDTPCIINVAPNLTDRYPLVREIDLSKIDLPRSSPTQSPQQTPSTSPSPTPNQSSPPASSLPTPTNTEPSPTIPEFPALVTPILLATSLALFVALKRRAKVQ